MKRIDIRTSHEPLERFLQERKEAQAEVEGPTAEIAARVALEGWSAVAEYTERFDDVRKAPEAGAFRVGREEFETASNRLDADLREAVTLSIDRVRRFHERQKRDDWFLEEEGIRTGQLFRPLERVGVYTPGGAAVLFSTLVMNVVPAQVAGCPEIVVCSPPQKRTGSVSEFILAVCGMLGLSHENVWSLGGPWAIFGLARGLPGLPAVDGVFGPGNRFVLEAKRRIQGEVRIESLPGNSEILVIADETANPEFVAADLLSQAEHAGGETAILVTPSTDLMDRVEIQVEAQLSKLERREIAARSLESGGLLVLARDLEQACQAANRVAPEHLEIQTEDPRALLDSIRHAGAIFLGPCSTEPIGDYTAGTNHVLPTGGRARFSSALSVDDFVKKISLVEVDAEGLAKIGPAAIRLAEAEGLGGHAEAIRKRLEV